MWGSIDITSKGEDQMEYPVTTDPDILNVGNVPRLSGSSRGKGHHSVLARLGKLD